MRSTLDKFGAPGTDDVDMVADGLPMHGGFGLGPNKLLQTSGIWGGGDGR